MLVAGAASWFGREVWKVKRPHILAKQKQELEHQAARQTIEIEREKKTITLLDTLSMTTLRQTSLMEKMSNQQDGHLKACDATQRMVGEIHSKVVKA